MELMQKAMMGVEDIFEKEQLSVADADLVTEVNEVLTEARERGQELDVERLKEQAYEVLKVSPCIGWQPLDGDPLVVQAVSQRRAG